MKDKAVTGSRRLADCPNLIEREQIGTPTLFVSHAWDARWNAVVNCVVDFANEKGLDKDKTFVWLDVVAVNQHRDMALRLWVLRLKRAKGRLISLNVA